MSGSSQWTQVNGTRAYCSFICVSLIGSAPIENWFFIFFSHIIIHFRYKTAWNSTIFFFLVVTSFRFHFRKFLIDLRVLCIINDPIDRNSGCWTQTPKPTVNSIYFLRIFSILRVFDNQNSLHASIKRHFHTDVINWRRIVSIWCKISKMKMKIFIDSFFVGKKRKQMHRSRIRRCVCEPRKINAKYIFKPH